MSAPFLPMMTPGARGVDRDATLAVRAFDDHTANAGGLAFLFDELAHPNVFEQKIAVILGVGIPAAVPSPIDLQSHSDGVDLVTH